MLMHLNLGSNVEPRRDFLSRALTAIAAVPQIHVVGSSRIYETPPVGLADQEADPFLNLCAGIRTSLRPEKVLQRTREIEEHLGRPASSKGARTSRSIDIDLVLAEDTVLDRPDLCLPHPGLLTRSFFLWPLVEICPNATCPKTGLPLKAFLPRQVLPPILRTLPGLEL
jgi:2-amino-4-hydroxy-6-hydroxymethyldihydropteridine diphosphokinase